MRDYCPSDYQVGDEHDPLSPWYEEPPEFAARSWDEAVDKIEDWLSCDRETAEDLGERFVYYSPDEDLYWIEERVEEVYENKSVSVPGV